MTDSQLQFGIMQNDERAWRHIYQEMRFGFASILIKSFANSNIRTEDIEDIFQESLVVLMRKVKDGSFVATRDGAMFSYLVEMGSRLTQNFLRKKRALASDKAVTISLNRHKEEETSISVDEKQQTQDEFLDRVFDLLPSSCKSLLKYFYWEHKPMDEIASILGMRNADSAKTKKSKCMNKFKEIAAQLIEREEFAEDAVRAAVERAALRDLIADEKFYADNDTAMAALKVDKEEKE